MKKCQANGFINLLEKIAHETLPQYCGRKNWIDTCKLIQNTNDLHPKWIFGAADGSGFDMSQLVEFNKLMNELIEAASLHPNFHWELPLERDDIPKVLKESLYMRVTMDNGKLKYTAVGRASGDGWTTFGNTMLMISYWTYTFHLAKIEDFFLLVKGDDVLFAFDPVYMYAFEQARKIVFTDVKTKHQHGLAQICKFVKYGRIEELDFLSNHFFWTDKGTLRMTRIPWRIIQTICWTTKLPQALVGKQLQQMRLELLFNKGHSLLAWSRGLPIWETLARKMIQLGRPGPTTESNVHVDPYRTWHDVNDYESYCDYLYQNYQITRQEVADIECSIKSIVDTTGVIEIPALSKLCYGI